MDAADAAKRAAEKILNGMGVCKCADCVENIGSELLPVFADRDRLAGEVAHLCADAAESDREIRESCKRVLNAAAVDGDRECVPPLSDVVEDLVKQVAELRRVLAKFRNSVPSMSNELFDEIDAALSAAAPESR